MTTLDFTAGGPDLELQVEKEIFALSGDVTSRLEPAEPFVFGMNKACERTTAGCARPSTRIR